MSPCSGLLRIEGEGRLDGRSLARLVRRLGSVSRWRQAAGLLIDMRGASVDMAQENLRSALMRVLGNGDLTGRHLAIVPGNHAGGHGFARTVAALATLRSADARVFANRDEAEGWLRHAGPRTEADALSAAAGVG